MGWVLFEVFIALAIAVAIVWWTFPSRPRDGAGRDGKQDTEDREER